MRDVGSRMLVLTCITSYVAASNSQQTLRLPSVFSSSMVLPSQNSIPFHGWAAPSSRIKVRVDSLPAVESNTTTSGLWRVVLPAMPPSLTSKTITVTSEPIPPAKFVPEKVVLSDVLVGSIYICSGQSNMELPVSQTLNGTAEALASETYAARMPVFQVATLPNYFNVTSPQMDLTPNVPWGAPTAARIAGFSALCYYHARRVSDSHPTVALGVIASSWGGTAIQPWMSDAAVARCVGEDGDGTSPAVLRIADFSPSMTPRDGIGAHDAAALSAVPSIPGTLWNAMLAPLLSLAPVAWLWYQGESNSGAPQQYQCLLAELIMEWRSQWPPPPEPSGGPIPFIVIGLAPWPDFDVGLITGLRYVQERVSRMLPRVGLVTSADLGDPAGANHPIHPPWKQEVARRSALLGEALVFHNKAVSPTGPQVLTASWDLYEPSWGDFHYDSNPGGQFCGSSYASSHGWICGGIQLTFDRAVALTNLQCTAQAFSKGASRAGCGALGSSGGFELWNGVDGNSTRFPGTVGPTGETLRSNLCTDCRQCPCMQPVEVWGLLPGSNGRVLQLNVTWIMGGGPGDSRLPIRLRYGWADYPSMSVFSLEDGRPAAPFNLTLSTQRK